MAVPPRFEPGGYGLHDVVATEVVTGQPQGCLAVSFPPVHIDSEPHYGSTPEPQVPTVTV